MGLASGPIKFPHQNPVYTSPLPHTCYMSRRLIILDLITGIYWVRSAVHQQNNNNNNNNNLYFHLHLSVRLHKVASEGQTCEGRE